MQTTTTNDQILHLARLGYFILLSTVVVVVVVDNDE